MGFIIKSCRNLLLLLAISGCDDNGGPATLSVFYDSTGNIPQIAFVCPNIQKGDSLDYRLLLQLYKTDKGITSDIPVITDYSFSNDTIFMVPRFPLDAGAEFEAIANVNRQIIKKRFVTPEIVTRTPEASVWQVFPLSNEIPSNILMFHIVFDNPMNEDPLAYTNIKLIDGKGEEKQMVWREKSNWTSDGKHLIMMIHPGWVKRDIHYLDKYGPDFEEGKKYTLVVTKNIKDRFNRNITTDYKKEFTIVSPDRKIPEINTRQKQKIRPGSHDTLFISFSEAMDYGSALSGIYVKDFSNAVVEGKKFLLADDKWGFCPDSAWQKKPYTIEFTENVTDVASNHFHRLFEEKNIDIMVPVQPVKITFTPY